MEGVSNPMRFLHSNVKKHILRSLLYAFLVVFTELQQLVIISFVLVTSMLDSGMIL